MTRMLLRLKLLLLLPLLLLLMMMTTTMTTGAIQITKKTVIMIIRIDVGVDAGVVMLVMTMMMHVLYFSNIYFK